MNKIIHFDDKTNKWFFIYLNGYKPSEEISLEKVLLFYYSGKKTWSFAAYKKILLLVKKEVATG